MKKNPACLLTLDDPEFKPKDLKVNVTCLAKGTGAWSIGLQGEDGSTHIENGNNGEWKTKTVTLSGVSEILLKHESGDDTVFHLIEVERL